MEREGDLEDRALVHPPSFLQTMADHGSLIKYLLVPWFPWREMEDDNHILSLMVFQPVNRRCSSPAASKMLS